MPVYEKPGDISYVCFTSQYNLKITLTDVKNKLKSINILQLKIEKWILYIP